MKDKLYDNADSFAMSLMRNGKMLIVMIYD